MSDQLVERAVELALQEARRQPRVPGGAPDRNRDGRGDGGQFASVRGGALDAVPKDLRAATLNRKGRERVLVAKARERQAGARTYKNEHGVTQVEVPPGLNYGATFRDDKGHLHMVYDINNERNWGGIGMDVSEPTKLTSKNGVTMATINPVRVVELPAGTKFKGKYKQRSSDPLKQTRLRGRAGRVREGEGFEEAAQTFKRVGVPAFKGATYKKAPTKSFTTFSAQRGVAKQTRNPVVVRRRSDGSYVKYSQTSKGMKRIGSGGASAFRAKRYAVRYNQTRVKNFQRANGLKPDGIVGPKTRAVIAKKGPIMQSRAGDWGATVQKRVNQTKAFQGRARQIMARGGLSPLTANFPTRAAAKPATKFTTVKAGKGTRKIAIPYGLVPPKTSRARGKRRSG